MVYSKLYLLPKIQDSLSNVPGRSVISKLGNTDIKGFRILDHQLQPLMEQRNLYIKNTGDFVEKLKAIGKIAIPVTVDLVALYCNFPNDESLKVFVETV